jgi:hypothetical protein
LLLLVASFFRFKVFRLVSRGTLEEQKYLRQVYKTQLKNETMVDIDDPERGKSARLFRGVAKDKTRRGELFGLSNLLRYEDGTLMKYGAEAKEARLGFGGGIYNMEAVMEAAQKTASAEDDDDDDDGNDVDFEAMTSGGYNNLGVADLAKRSEKSTLPVSYEKKAKCITSGNKFASNTLSLCFVLVDSFFGF